MLVQSFIQAKQQANRRPSWFESKDCLYKKSPYILYHSREPKTASSEKEQVNNIYTYLIHPPADGWT